MSELAELLLTCLMLVIFGIAIIAIEVVKEHRRNRAPKHRLGRTGWVGD